MKRKYNVQKEDYLIKAVIGEYDDPYNQRQNVVMMNLSYQGNTIIYGNTV